MTIDRDDELLTALSQGVRPDPDDPMAELLADWHADLAADLPAPAPVRRRRWWARPIAVGLATGVLALGGTTAMAATAQPGSPLWPITQKVYPERAHSRAAEQAAKRLLDQAATAVQDHRTSDAITALNDAVGQIALVTDPVPRDRLIRRWITVRDTLFTGTPIVAATPAASPIPAIPVVPKPASTPAPGRSSGGPSGGSTGGGLPLPLPLPSLPLPQPSLPLPELPPILPSLLPHGPG
jgi:hypothetical protein